MIDPRPQELYDSFMKKVNETGMVGPDEVGRMVATFGGHFGNENKNLAKALKAYRKIAAKLEQSTDDNGKPISSAKATKMAEATVEADDLLDAKTAVENIDKQIFCLQALQKGISKEFGASSY